MLPDIIRVPAIDVHGVVNDLLAKVARRFECVARLGADAAYSCTCALRNWVCVVVDVSDWRERREREVKP